ncbi:MAG TPA: hypothetical protein VGT08_06210 [Terracidiphilus sp.]|nr:hypothetical protein [Terracidiphilus sp.]
MDGIRLSRTKEQFSALRRFQDKCDLEAITLLACNATRGEAGTAFAEPYSIRPGVSNVSSSQSGRLFVAKISFEYDAWDSSEPSQRLFQVNCTFEISYRLREGYIPTDEERMSFSHATAVFNCWPYAREFFRDMTSRLGHNAPVLPLLHVIPKQQAAAQQPELEAPDNANESGE